MAGGGVDARAFIGQRSGLARASAATLRGAGPGALPQTRRWAARGHVMTAAKTIDAAVQRSVCPLCHASDNTDSADLPEPGAAWVCARCGQNWTAARLEVVTAYALFAAAHER